jgi:glutamate/tyrosine decarboxylase-like PLP-dependent enzyme
MAAKDGAQSRVLPDLADGVLERVAARAAALYVEVYRGLEARPVSPGTTRADLRRLLAGRLGDQGAGLEAALEDFETLLLPHSMGIAHPLYMGLVNSSPLPGGPLGDLLVSALNNNSGAFSQGPAAWACERELVEALLSLVGLPEGSDGMILPGGTFANLQGLLLARTRAFGPRAPASARLYTSEAAHFSVARSARVLGFEDSQIVTVAVRGRGELDPDRLAQEVRRDRADGRHPFAVVATAGTTGTGAIDPLGELAALRVEETLWMHVDACYGGAALLLPEVRHRFTGIERADSVAVDLHKWFFAPIAAGVLLTAHPEWGELACATTAGTYIPQDGQREAWQWGIPTSRRASSLTVWLALRAHGWDVIRGAARRNIALVRLLEGLLAARGFEILPAGELSVACARAPSPGTSASEADALQSRIAATVARSGRAWFSTVRHQGRTWLRFNLLNVHTREEHIARLAELVTATRDSCLSTTGEEQGSRGEQREA